MKESQRLLLALEQERDLTLFLPLADAFLEEGHPDAEELCGLAGDIAGSDDMAEAAMAATVFLAVLEASGVDVPRWEV